MIQDLIHADHFICRQAGIDDLIRQPPVAVDMLLRKKCSKKVEKAPCVRFSRVAESSRVSGVPCLRGLWQGVRETRAQRGREFHKLSRRVAYSS